MENSNKITLDSIKNPLIIVRALKNNKLGLAKISDVGTIIIIIILCLLVENNFMRLFLQSIISLVWEIMCYSL